MSQTPDLHSRLSAAQHPCHCIALRQHWALPQTTDGIPGWLGSARAAGGQRSRGCVPSRHAGVGGNQSVKVCVDRNVHTGALPRQRMPARVCSRLARCWRGWRDLLGVMRASQDALPLRRTICFHRFDMRTAAIVRGSRSCSGWCVNSGKARTN